MQSWLGSLKVTIEADGKARQAKAANLAARKSANVMDVDEDDDITPDALKKKSSRAKPKQQDPLNIGNLGSLLQVH